MNNDRVHLKLNNGLTACGLSAYVEACYDARDCNCPECKTSEEYTTYMGIKRCPKCGGKDMASQGHDIICSRCFEIVGNIHEEE